jgi:hypothetical protein
MSSPMKTRNRIGPLVVTISSLALVSCKTEDPSALGESQKALAEAVAKNMRMEEEIAALRSELEEAKSKVGVASELQMPTRSQIEKGLDKQGALLKEKARQDYPNGTVESYKTWDLNIPSFETPYSCKVALVVREPSGKSHTLYWTGSADIKGNWSFTSAANLEPANPVASKQAEPQRGPNREYDIDPENDPPLIEPGPNINTPSRSEPPAPPANPKPKYDIPLDRPVMGPGSR